MSDGKKCESGACIQVDIYAGEHLAEPVVRVHSTETGTVMQCRISEWVKFVAEIQNGDWAHISTDYEIFLERAATRERQEKILNGPLGPIPALSDLVDEAEHKAR